MKQILWNKQEIAESLGQNIEQDLDHITGVSIDTRSIEKGDMFFAIRGENFNGNNFANEAIEKGASLCIVDEIVTVKESNKHKVILVKSVMEALNNLASYRRNSLKGKVIGITGSVGKTSTKEMLKLALSSVGKTYATAKSFNNHYGTPFSLVQTPLDTDFCILELGMNHAGEIRYLSEMARPDIAIVVNIHPTHLEFFNSVEEIAYAKAEIFENVKASGFGIINADNAHYAILHEQAAKFGVKTLAFGNAVNSDCQIIDIEQLENGDKMTHIHCMDKNIQQKFNKDVGEHLIQNSLAIFICLTLLNVDMASPQKALEQFVPFLGRGQILNLSNNITLIDESYNSSPAALLASINNAVLRKKNESRVVAILGDMKELGKEEVDFHKSVNLEGVDKIFCVGSLMKHLYDGANAKLQGACTNNSEEMANIISKHLQNNDIILVKGSYSMNMKLIVERIKKESITCQN
jgi:UDP-N-acetylmuramoyl-tripeptide--D-alanyl-D-alanine ligase